MNKQTIYDIDAAGKTVYVRVDYNVPCDREHYNPHGHIPFFPATSIRMGISPMTEESVLHSRPSDIY